MRTEGLTVHVGGKKKNGENHSGFLNFPRSRNLKKKKLRCLLDQQQSMPHKEQVRDEWHTREFRWRMHVLRIVFSKLENKPFQIWKESDCHDHEFAAA